MQIIKYPLTAIVLAWFNPITIAAQPLQISATEQLVDTTENYIDFLGNNQSRKTANFIKKWWPQDGKIRMTIHEISSGYFIRKGWYTDETLQQKAGVFESYHANGVKKDSGFFNDKLRVGTFKTWHESGTLNSIRHFENDILVDTGKAFDLDGNLILLSVTDKQGNGTETAFYPTGKISQTGKLKQGEKEGSWLVSRENGTSMMQIEFKNNAELESKCFSEDGKTEITGNCVNEKNATFPGGHLGFAQFLKLEQQYPDYAIENDIQGVVLIEFDVEKDGSLSEIKVVYSTHEVLSKEVLRTMESCPKWEPAIRMNQAVQSTQRHPISFHMNKIRR
jgi:protein TonB